MTLAYHGSPQEYDALEAAVQRAVGDCVCGPLMRLGVGQKCRACEMAIETLACLLAATDAKGRATVAIWAEWKESRAEFLLREPR